MNSFNIIYTKHGKYAAIIYPISYLNPIEDIHLISIELKKHISAGSYVLFDLLLSNGDNFNRFAEALYNGEELSSKEVSITTIPENEVQDLNLYYRGRTKELSKSVLTARERFKFATSKKGVDKNLDSGRNRKEL